jgi:hypothetical protein
MDYTSKSLPDPVADRFEDLQPEDMTVGEFTTACLDAYEQQNTNNADGVDEVLGRLDDLEARLPEKTAQELEHRFR